MTTPTFPPGRYGHRRERRAASRLARGVLLSGVVLAGLAVAFGYYQRFGPPEYQADVVGWDSAKGPSAAPMTLRVTRPDGKPTVCTVRSRAQDGAEVGRGEVRVPAGRTTVDVSYVLHTSRQAYTAEVVGCGPGH
ncbi:DUF4307 domain-containing protein [Actinocatenispora rupis]|uniref:DUF4307 domain-containing protein n=1 Tax=Actinocatenispora rupis TaxID=519421 RepID=UPI0019421A7B|nr:DUF4307 domain-containing protein [Actinocatenispora rupis]